MTSSFTFSLHLLPSLPTTIYQLFPLPALATEGMDLEEYARREYAIKGNKFTGSAGGVKDWLREKYPGFCWWAVNVILDADVLRRCLGYFWYNTSQ